MISLLLSCSNNGASDSTHTDDTGTAPIHFVLAPPMRLTESLGPCMDAELADLDGNGTLDVVLAMEFFDNVILWNDGAALFTPETLDVPSPSVGSPGRDSEEAAAFDVDGDLDLYLCSRATRDQILLREGG